MNTPIVDFVKKYADAEALRLHMPGHKGNSLCGYEKLDITEIDGADILYDAKGIIAESEENAAALFGTKRTFYSTEGSSLAIRAMTYLIKKYAAQKGEDTIIAAGRNAHKTFVAACAVLDIDVDWLLPDSAQTVMSCVVTPDFLENYLRTANKKPTAVYITSPDYLGNVSDVLALSAVCRKFGVLLVVDNAHGAYQRFLANDSHPITLGADMSCDSAHKTLPALTGGAYLHIGKNAPEFLESNAQKALGLFASTSPSYLILQSLDMVNKYLAEGYAEKLSDFIKRINELKSKLSHMGYCLCGDEPLKITISAKPYGYTGRELAHELLGNNIVCEFADPDYVVMMLTPETGTQGLCRLEKVLGGIPAKPPILKQPPALSLKKKRVSLNAAIYAPQKEIGIETCLGETSASADAVCPPAIPIVLPGEEIDSDAMECFKYYGIDKWIVLK